MRKAFDKYNKDLYKYNRRSREYAFNKRHKSPELRSAFRRYNRDNEKYQRELRKIQFQKYGAQYFIEENIPTATATATPITDKVPLDKFVVNVILNNDECNSLRGTPDEQTVKTITEAIASAINSDIANQVANVIVTMDEPTAGYTLGSYPRCKKGKPCGNTCIPKKHTCHIDKEQCIIITKAIFDALG